VSSSTTHTCDVCGGKTPEIPGNGAALPEGWFRVQTSRLIERSPGGSSTWHADRADDALACSPACAEKRGVEQLHRAIEQLRRAIAAGRGHEFTFAVARKDS
jgi:hypothetical protein